MRFTEVRNTAYNPLMSSALQTALEKLRRDGASEAVQAAFGHAFARVASGESGLLREADLEPVETLPTLDSLEPFRKTGERQATAVAILKLNGGLGTSMGLDRAKSLLRVKGDRTFLDIIAVQALSLRRKHGADIPLLFMNSYRTEADTQRALARYPELGWQRVPMTFLQNRIPKLRADSLEPVEWPADPEKEWCPPGHGDLYAALAGSGMMARLLAAGFRYLFVSNADNLGAILDERLLGYMAENEVPFLMEVTARTEADRKGGHLARAKDGRLILRESAQCPPEEREQFQNIARHRYFNTNNFWIDLCALDRLMRERGGPPDLPVMINRKNVDPADPTSPPVVQLETAMGAAIAVFPGARAIDVPRTRFAPVKTTDDLLALWSDAYRLEEDGGVVLDPARRGMPPVIKLDPTFYRLWPDFAARFPRGAPSLLACDVLEVAGDVVFGPGVVVRGRVQLKNQTSAPQTLAHCELANETREWR